MKPTDCKLIVSSPHLVQTVRIADVHQALAADLRLEQNKHDMALGMLEAFPVWIRENFDFKWEDEQ